MLVWEAGLVQRNKQERGDNAMSEFMDRYNWFYKAMINMFKISENDRYGRNALSTIAEEYMKEKKSVTIVDIAAGSGTDLLNVSKKVKQCEKQLFACEAYMPNIQLLESKGISTFSINLEREKLPFTDNSVDIVIANQILEHTKELFWIFSEIGRILKENGIIIIGVPNLASLHCRLMLLVGKQPTCIETNGPHVRGFTYKDFKWFIEDEGYFKVYKRIGTGFYSFIPRISYFLAKIFPNAAINMTIGVRKTEKAGSFLSVLNNYKYETNYYVGEEQKSSFLS